MHQDGRHVKIYVLVALAWAASLLVAIFARRSQASSSNASPLDDRSTDATSEREDSEVGASSDIFSDLWESHDAAADGASSSIVPVVAFLLPMGLTVWLSIQTFLPIVGPEFLDALGRALSGLPVLLTAVGAGAVALALIVRSAQPALAVKKSGAEAVLRNFIKRRPTMSYERAKELGAVVAVWAEQWSRFEEQAAADVRKAAKRLNRSSSTAASLEFSGAFVLFLGAITAFWAWSVGV